MRKVKIEDIGAFVAVDEPCISPCGNRVAFVAGRTLVKEDKYESNVWIFHREKRSLKQLTSGGNDYNPIWSPSGDRILFLSSRDSNEIGIWIIDLEGESETSPVVTKKGEISQPSWSPDGESILFLWRPINKEEVKEIKTIPFWVDNQGFTYHSAVQVFSLNILTRRERQLTNVDMDVQGVAFSNDGKKIAYIVAADKENPYTYNVKIMDFKGENVKTVGTGFMYDGPMYPVWSPDNEHIVVQGSRFEKGFASHNNLWLISVDGGKPKNLTKGLTVSTGGDSLYCDTKNPYSYSPQGPVWEGDHIYFLLSEGGSVKLASLGMRKDKIRIVEGGNIGISKFSVRDDYIVYSGGTDIEPFEIWESKGEKKKKLTHFNDSVTSDLKLPVPKQFAFQASDGEQVEGWYIKPVDFDQDKSYPAIVWVHGGPKSKFGYGFMHEFQLFAASGYVVIYINPRGSDGFTQKFADIREHYGEKDYKDIMEGLDWMESNCSWIDPERIGLTGISYGGFMTNWLITQTDRFAAAVSEDGISDWISMFGITDIGYFFCKDAVGGDLWNNLDKYVEKSPLFKADRVVTPTMFIHSMDDYRCGMDQSIQFYTALCYLGKEAKLLLFPEGGHIFAWTGKPRLRIKRLENMLSWFDKFLKEKNES